MILADTYFCVRHFPSGKIRLRGRVQLNLPGLDELHDTQRNKTFADRRDWEQRLRRNRLPLFRFAESARVYHVVSMSNGDREALELLRGHLRFQKGVNGFRIKRLRG